MLTPTSAVGQFLGDLERQSRSRTGRSVDSYRRTLNRFTDQFRNVTNMDVSEITTDDVRQFLDLCSRRKAGSGRISINTQATIYSHLNSFFKWLYGQGRIKRNPMEPISRPKRQRPQDLDVVKVTSDDVRKLLAAGETWAEKLVVRIPVYMGSRRSALAQLRFHDWNQETNELRFYEKGGKTVWKPIPDDLVSTLQAALADGEWKDGSDYLIKNEHPTTRDDRDDRIIWRLVRKVAHRAGVTTHVHALRAAFAVFYLESNVGDLEGLQGLMGHESLATTQTYLRMLNQKAAMERVRSLSWGAVA